MVIDIAESLITILKSNKALLLLKLTICNFFENLIYFWVTLMPFRNTTTNTTGNTMWREAPANE